MVLLPLRGNLEDYYFHKAQCLTSFLNYVSLRQVSRKPVTSCYVRYPPKIVQITWNV